MIYLQLTSIWTKKVELAENHPRRASHPEGHFSKGLLYAAKNFNRAEIVRAFEVSFIYCHDLITAIELNSKK